MSEEPMALNQKERDWLQWLHQAKRKQITQREAAQRMQVSERWVRQLLRRMKRQKDRVVVHGLRGRPSNRRLEPETQQRAIAMVGAEYRDFGPTLAAEYLQEKHGIQVSRETLRQWMIAAGLWRPGPQLRNFTKKSAASAKQNPLPSPPEHGWPAQRVPAADLFGASSVASALDVARRRDPASNALTLTPPLPPPSQNRNFLLCTI
jgi:DNA-binding Lrp family transcriptional regulator